MSADAGMRERRVADFGEFRNQSPETKMEDCPGGHAGSLAIGYRFTEAGTALTSAFAVTYLASAKLPSATPPAAVPVAVRVALAVAGHVAQTVAV